MVANKSCKYLLVDGSTARFATDVKHCRKVVATGDPVYPASNSFVVPKRSALFEPLANATLKLLEEGRLESLESYFERRGSCVLPETTVITFGKLQLFFIAAYAVTALIFLEMILDPQQLEPIGREVKPGRDPSDPAQHQHGSTDDMDESDDVGIDIEPPGR